MRKTEIIAARNNLAQLSVPSLRRGTPQVKNALRRAMDALDWASKDYQEVVRADYVHTLGERVCSLAKYGKVKVVKKRFGCVGISLSDDTDDDDAEVLGYFDSRALPHEVMEFCGL